MSLELLPESMPQPYKVKCLDAKYDEDSQMLVLNCHFNALGSNRLVVIPKSNFHRGKPGMEVPDSEMHRTAKMFKRFPWEFNLVIEDDPNREQINTTNYEQYVRSFTGEMGEHLGKVTDGLVDEAGQVSRRLGRLMDEGKLDVRKLVESELAIRARLGG